MRVQVKVPSVLDQLVLQEAPLLIVSGQEMQIRRSLKLLYRAAIR